MKQFLWLLCLSLRICISNETRAQDFLTPSRQKQHWVDSVYESLSPDHRLGQLFVVAAFSNKDQNHVERTLDLVCNYNIGGLCFFQGGPVRQAQLTNYYQANSITPLLISIDGEWGLAMRIDSTIRFPRQMTLGAMRNEKMIYEMGKEIARECKRIGIHVNLAPVIDINNNPNNPVISVRSFGEDKESVTRKALLYMHGMQDQGVMANGKHFPGHGDTDVDSHKGLPVINKSLKGLDSLELYPFRKLISDGLQSMMVAHLFIPSLDSSKNIASTLSPRVVNGLLKHDLGFRGLVFTDALNMKGVSSFFPPGRVDVKALLAGNDVLLYSEDVPKAISEIKKAILNGEISDLEIEMRVKKILEAKYWCGLNHYEPVKIQGLYEDLNTPEAQYLNQQLFENSLTLLRNKDGILPLMNETNTQIASVICGDSINVPFNKMLPYFSPVDFFSLDKNKDKKYADTLWERLKSYQTVILSIHNTNISAVKNFGITDIMSAFIAAKPADKKLILTVFGNPYTLTKLSGLNNAEGLILAYEGTEQGQQSAAQAIFGAIGMDGKLPVSINADFKRGNGLELHAIQRLKYTVPEELGLSSLGFTEIDSICQRAIRQKATPGCQVLVAQKGKVIYYKSFGKHSYVSSPSVKNTDLYDIASVTKIAATTLALMWTYEHKGVTFDKKIIKYLPELKKTNKKDIVFREMLAHQSGLVAWIPFWKGTMNPAGLPDPALYSKTMTSEFPIRVAEELYIRKDYPDTIWQKILDSPLSKEKKYVYSDLGFMITRRIVEKESGLPLDSLVKSVFYNPLNLSTMGFLPRKRFPLTRIVPTEYDEKFRRQLVHGDVHDPGAAMLGGVSGHAGLFSDASDLAVLLQMLLNGGEYAGHKYLKSSTIQEFTRKQFEGNRRGLGFDKPETDPKKSSPTSKSVSSSAYGHSGFTGTCFWVDPEHDLIYIFLSNRVHPDAENDKLVKMNVRTDIQEAIYKAILTGTE